MMSRRSNIVPTIRGYVIYDASVAFIFASMKQVISMATLICALLSTK